MACLAGAALCVSLAACGDRSIAADELNTCLITFPNGNKVRAEFVCAAGIYEGRWLDHQFKKDETDPERKAERLWSKAAAESVSSFLNW